MTEREPRLPRFGQYIRAARLGYHWHEKLNAFMRIDSEGPPWRIDIAPAGGIVCERGRRDQRMYRVWWPAKPGEDPVELSPVLRTIKAVHRPIRIYLNDEGERVNR